jgi:hypothetical protein
LGIGRKNMPEDDLTWELSNGAVAVPQNKKKMPFVTLIKITDDMDDNSKKFFTTYNSMQKELVKNGLMDSK